MLKLLNIDPASYSPEAKAILSSIGRMDNRILARHELISEIVNYDVLLLRFAHRIDREVLTAAKKLKVIGLNVTGPDHIDLEAAKKRGIAVITLKGEYDFLRTIHATAEHTWCLLLALLRQLGPALDSVKKGLWDRQQFIGKELCGKSLGIVGLGRIGSKIADYGKAFSMTVQFYDRDGSKKKDGVARVNSLQKLLPQTDILTIHVPLNGTTWGMIGKKEIGLLPRGAVLINTSRGPVVDDESLLSALESGHLSGAALDVLCDENDEGFLKVSKLWQYALNNTNLLITPHIGGATKESLKKTEIFIAKKVVAHFRSIQKQGKITSEAF